MAMVLDALAAYIQNKLMEIMEEKVHMLLGVPSEIERMKVKLADLMRFLADADRRNITDETVREWVKEFRGIMYDATDILDMCQLKAMEQGPSQDMGCFSPLLSCVRNPVHTHKISKLLKALNVKIDDIGRRSRTFNFSELTAYEDHRRNNESSWLASRETTGGLDRLDLVGEKIEEDTRNLVKFLTGKEETNSENNKIMIFAIVGVGGIGKTTLAQNIFNNEIIQQEFQKRIWLSVNQNSSEFDLLKRIITEARGNYSVAGNTKATLVQILKEAVEGHKILLVMDDVWNHEAWEVLKSPLTNMLAPGSRILMTTRHDMVARGMMAEEPYYHVDKLEQEDAWCLLKKQVVKNEDEESRADILLKDIGMGIVARCDGLPLAIKAMGGLLRQKKISRCDWESVLHDPIWSEESHMPKHLNNAINLSYQNLPFYLKPCFLHFSLLPKSTIFYIDIIIGMWISEGFVHGDSRDLEELAREYYRELIMRNLIEPNRMYVDEAVCSMHDVVRSFGQYVARDEALAADISCETDILSKLNSVKFIRRISIDTIGSKSDQLEWMSLQTLMSLRTLILVGPIKIKPPDSLVNFLGLRSLHIENANFNELAQSLVHLQHLRYLSIINTDTSMLPENIGDKMKFLQYISVSYCGSLVKLPSSIGKLQHLRTLDLRCSNINNVPKGFSGPTNLRNLYGFPAHMDGDWCSLEALGTLSKLIELSIYGLENISSSLFATKARLCEKVRLSYLRLNWRSKDGDDSNLAKQQQMEELFDKLCPLPCLENFEIKGYFGSRLPRWMMTASAASLGSLRILMMEDLPYCIELPDSLCQLPYLEFLKIENAPLIKSIGPEFLQPHNYEYLSSTLGNLYSVVELEVSECPGLTRLGNLPKTKELKIIKCPNLKVLEGMPALQILILVDYKMKTLPRYLQNVNPKQLLDIACHASLLGSIAIGKYGPEWDKFCHVGQVKVYAAEIDDNDIERKWYVKYTRDPFSFKTNVSRSQIAQARWLAYEKTCPIEEKPTAGHACADKRQPLCQRFRNNPYRYLSWWLLDEACLHCCEAQKIAASSDQWDEAEVYPAYAIIWLTPQQFARPGGRHYVRKWEDNVVKLRWRMASLCLVFGMHRR